jgi:hypothetical protein
MANFLSMNNMFKMINKYNTKTYSKKENFVLDNEDRSYYDSFKINKTTLMTLITISLIFWGITIFVLISNWTVLPDWAKVFAVLSLINPNLGGPITTLIIIFISRSNK